MSRIISVRGGLLIAAAISLAAPLYAGAQTVRDSAGIRIVMNEKPLWTAAQQGRRTISTDTRSRCVLFVGRSHCCGRSGRE
jgi:hypothetical protein